MTSWVLLVFIICKCTSTMAGFAEVPANVTVELGTAAPPCRCRHTSSDAFITWRVNGIESGQFSGIRPGFVNEDGNRVATLTIPAEPQYNGTVVECVAVFLDGSAPTEVSPEAIIFFTPTATPFGIIPSPLTVAVEQGNATFQCQHPLADMIDWRVNEIPLNVATFQSISSASIKTPNGTTSTLSVATLLVYNGITVECAATLNFTNESLPQLTPAVVLLIQGIPNEVEDASCQRNYSKDELMTLWNPLPTLDINFTDPDILYTVELYNITCGQNILINRTEVAGSNVTEEGLDLMQIYKAVIAARNNVRGARNGPSVQMEEKFMSLNGPTLLNLTRNSLIKIQSGTPVPSYYKMILESLDGHEDLITNIIVDRDGEMIDMHVEESVPPNSLWRASILAYGCESDRVVNNYELSTHDIQNVVASSQLPGQISVTGELISGATATGVLVIAYSLTNSSDLHYVVNPAKEARISLNVTGLTGAEYGVSTFALENGLPFSKVLTSPTNITINSHQDRVPQQQPFIQYDVTRTSTGACIMCTFSMDSSATDCVAVVHQRISQLSSSGLMNIKSSHKFTRSGDTAYGCIEGANLEQYQVGVIGGKMITVEPKSNPRESSLAGAIVGVLGGIVVAVIVTVAVIVAVVACTRLKRRRKTAAQPIYREVTPGSGSQPHTIVNIGSGSRAAVENDFESAGLPEKNTEDQPLLPPPPLPARVEDDGGSSPGVSTPHVPGSADHGTHTSPTTDNGADDPTAEENPPPLPPRLDDSAPVSESTNQGTNASPHQVTSDKGAGNPTYAPVLTTTPHTVSQPAATEKVSYEDIQKYQNGQGQHYALPQMTVAKKGPVDDLHQVVYTEVKPHSMTKTGDQNIDCTSDRAVTPPPVPSRETATAAVCELLTADQLFSFLLPHASKWQSLGEILSLDEDRLDEIFTNNMTDEICLQEMLELYMLRSDLDHSWAEVQAALEKIGLSNVFSESIQEVSPSQSSPVISGKTVLVPGMDQGKQSAVGEEESSDCEEHRDSGYSGSQQSDSDSSGSSEIEDNSTNPSPASLEEHSESSEKLKPTHTTGSGDLEDHEYESSLDPPSSCEATHTDCGNSHGRAIKEELPTPVPCTPITSCPSAVEGFCEKAEDPRKDEELCTISPVHCQDSHTHTNYNEALIHQMRLQTDLKAKEKLEHNDAVEESSPVHIGNGRLHQRVQHALKSSDFNYLIAPTAFYP